MPNDLFDTVIDAGALAVPAGMPGRDGGGGDGGGPFLPLTGGELSGPLTVGNNLSVTDFILGATVYAPGMNDPLLISVDHGLDARIRYEAHGTRLWSAGAMSSGNFGIVDETARATRLQIDDNGTVTIAGQTGDPLVITGNGFDGRIRYQSSDRTWSMGVHGGIAGGGFMLADETAPAGRLIVTREGLIRLAGPVQIENASGIVVTAAFQSDGNNWNNLVSGDPNWGNVCSFSTRFVGAWAGFLMWIGGMTDIAFRHDGGITRSIDGAEVYWHFPSDERLKTNIQPTEVDALATLRSIPIESFDWIEDMRDALYPPSPEGTRQSRKPADMHRPIGWVAQHLIDIVPDWVRVRRPSTANPVLPDDLHSVAPSDGGLPFLIRAIQQLDAEVRALKGGSDGR
jgi:hypothetical protein